MMLTPQEVEKLKEELLSCKRPLFFFHDDPDGLASFLLCYRFVKEGRGLPIKAYPNIKKEPYARKVEEYGADKVFVLDVAMVEQEFIDAVKVPIVWVDHHTLLERDNVLYLNPQKRGVNVPTPALIWQVTADERPEDLWLATVGTIGDWYLPDFAKEFQKKYPELLPKRCKKVEDALFNSDVGTLVKVFSFNLKGSMKDVLESIKVLTRIDDPYDILEQKTAKGRLLWKRYLAINTQYEALLSEALKEATDDKLYVHIYQDDRLSLTKDVSNELLYKLKDKVIVFGRHVAGEMRCSLRAPAGVQLSQALQKALVGIQGYGGGHEQACGAAIKSDDFDQFLKNLREELNL
ncbi:hypothetical protein COV18_00995 [Candidatus Woesearchaeota archaeon CG10_big_fil_rev_8_21_14_0_10_37_12]|nr:MAG: hypothetical protein COV18_00995 [Candidatus Woesearchaeota archaeon CG10_big_fil_rev_8_21_14_0_10_37_12]